MRKPIRKLRCGPIVLSVWEHSKVVANEMVKFHSITIDKVYKDGDSWKYTKNFVVEDIPKIRILADDVYRALRVKVEDLTKQPDEEYENASVEDNDGNDSQDRICQNTAGRS